MARPIKKNKGKNMRAQRDLPDGVMVVAPNEERSHLLFGQLNKQLPLIVPDRWHCRLRYRNQRTVTTTFASQPFWWAVALNSLYDPDVSGVGGAVTGYSQLMAFYQKSVVVRAKATWTVVNNSASAASTVPVRLVALASTTSSSLTTANAIIDAAEQPLCAEATLGSQGGVNSVVTLEVDVPVHKVYGVKKSSILDEVTFWGTASSNPTNLGTIQLGATAMDGSSALAFIWSLDIEYEAILFNRVIFT
jgi:hypothetical protein